MLRVQAAVSGGSCKPRGSLWLNQPNRRYCVSSISARNLEDKIYQETGRAAGSHVPAQCTQGPPSPSRSPPPGPFRPFRPYPSVPLPCCGGPSTPAARHPSHRASHSAELPSYPGFCRMWGIVCVCAMIDSRTLFSYFVSTSHTTSDDSRWGNRTTLCELGADGCVKLLCRYPSPHPKKKNTREKTTHKFPATLLFFKQNKTKVVRKNVMLRINGSLLCYCSLS